MVSVRSFLVVLKWLGLAKVDVCGSESINVLVVSLMIVMINECLDLRFQVCREEVIFQQDAVLQGLMPPLYLALCLRMIRCPPDVPLCFSHPAIQPNRQRRNLTRYLKTLRSVA